MLFVCRGARGDWGSIQLNADGTGTAQFTSAVHSAPGKTTGAQHLALVASWSALASTTVPKDAVAPDPNHNYLVITAVKDPELGPPLVTPATPGKYSFNRARSGMPAVVYMINIRAT